MKFKMLKKLKAIKKLSIVIIGIVAIALITSVYTHSLNLAGIRDYINSFGSLVPIILLIIIILTSSVGFIFSVPVAIAAFVLDVPGAFFVSLIGLTVGAMISFFMARRLGRDYVEDEIISKIEKLKHYNKHLKNKGFRTITFLRLFPLMPYELVNLAGGFSKISPSAFFLGTVLGIIPGTLITIYLVRLTNQARSPEFIFVVILWAMLCIIPLLSKKVRKTIFG